MFWAILDSRGVVSRRRAGERVADQFLENVDTDEDKDDSIRPFIRNKKTLSNSVTS